MRDCPTMKELVALTNALMLLAIKGWDNGVLKSRIKNTDILNLI